jgi:hypothetical protein
MATTIVNTSTPLPPPAHRHVKTCLPPTTTMQGRTIGYSFFFSFTKDFLHLEHHTCTGRDYNYDERPCGTPHTHPPPPTQDSHHITPWPPHHR